MKKKVVKKKPLKKLAKKIQHKIETDYLGKIYGGEFLKLVPKAVKRLRAYRKKNPFDAIAFTGSSGAGLAFPLSYFLKVPLIHVRKKDKNHYGEAIEGTISSKRYLIVDDFIESGNSIRRIIKSINSNYEHQAIPVGIFLYDSYTRMDFDDIPVITFPRSR